jgi:hypothetical protein
LLSATQIVQFIETWLNNERYERKKKTWKNTETLITTSLISFKRSWWDEFSDTEKYHQRWLQVIPNIFGRLMWSTLFTICDIFLCHWILFVEIFSMTLVISLSKFQYIYEVFFSYVVFCLDLLFTPCKLWRYMRVKKEKK